MIPRYSRKEITEVWDTKNKFQIWLNIEILICEALNKYGKIPNSALKNIKKKAKFDQHDYRSDRCKRFTTQFRC